MIGIDFLEYSILLFSFIIDNDVEKGKQIVVTIIFG